jgi:xanthine/uracil permease
MRGASATNGRAMFDVLPGGKVPLKDTALMGLQNVFVMTGCFVFPGIMGKSFDLPVDTVADLYGATFIGCGLTTLLIAALFGRMPLVAGPYAGVFAALLSFGHMPGSNLGTGFGSLCVASLLWCLLAIPIRGVSGISFLARTVRNPVIAGAIVMLVMMQIADLAFPHWLGKTKDPTFPLINLGAGLVTAIVLMMLTISRVTIFRRLALLIALAAGALTFEYFHAIDFGAVASSPWFVLPHFFAFGFSVDPQYVFVFFLILVAINIQTLTLMGVVGKWTGEEMSPARLSWGVFSMMLGSALASCIGAFSNLPYPANIALLRSTRVASRQVTIATGIILIVMGFCTKVDYIFVLLPVPVLAAAATVLFGMVFVHGVEMLGEADWNQRQLAITGFSLMLGFGTLFLEPEVLNEFPLVVRLLLKQPIIVGVASLVIVSAILPGRPSRVVEEPLPTPAPDLALTAQSLQSAGGSSRPNPAPAHGAAGGA